MKIKETKILQNERLKEICLKQGVNHNSLLSLLESVRAKKIKRVNYHQQKIVDVIENSVK